MSYKDKLNSREAWLRRLKIYWSSPSSPHFISRVGEIYEVDFGMNVGTEFSGRHLAICLRDTTPSQEKMLVIPMTTKFEAYNISPEDMVETCAINGTPIKAGVVLGEATWISKFRVFRSSSILKDPIDANYLVKGYIDIPNIQLRRWLKL